MFPRRMTLMMWMLWGHADWFDCDVAVHSFQETCNLVMHAGLWYLVRLSSNHVRSLIGNMIVLYLSYDSMILGYINHGEPPQPCSQNIQKHQIDRDFQLVSLWIWGMAVSRLVLVNGFIGIGTGWATQGPNFDALQVWELSSRRDRTGQVGEIDGHVIIYPENISENRGIIIGQNYIDIGYNRGK